ncbi:unnamed protein product [Caenorhabditis sp. 36 PRJEB53466]|nr:unnamed protein product [Caenorhabditis sp. 36 PRJEB53466]
MSDSTRTAIPKSEVSTAIPAATPKRENSVKEVVESIWQTLISCVLWIVDFLNAAFEAIADAIVKIYRICLFCYRKPHHAKELLVTTIHLIRVSYDAEIWTWTDMWEVLKSHLIAPMTKSAPSTPQKPKPKEKEKQK